MQTGNQIDAGEVRSIVDSILADGVSAEERAAVGQLLNDCINDVHRTRWAVFSGTNLPKDEADARGRAYAAAISKRRGVGSIFDQIAERASGA